MKRVLVVLFAGLMMAGLASATSVFYQCDIGSLTSGIWVAQFNGGTGTATSYCPGFTVPQGDIVTGVSVWFTGDFQYGLTPSNTVQLVDTPNTGTWSESGWYSATVTCDITGAGNSTTNPCTYNVSTPPSSVSEVYNGDPTQFINGFTVNDISSVVSGQVTTSSTAVEVEYDFVPLASVPEPATMAMVGGLLIGLGTWARRRRA